MCYSSFYSGFDKTIPVECQTLETQIRLLLKEQSDLGLHCYVTCISVLLLRVTVVLSDSFIHIKYNLFESSCFNVCLILWCFLYGYRIILVEIVIYAVLIFLCCNFKLQSYAVNANYSHMFILFVFDEIHGQIKIYMAPLSGH